MSYHFPTEIIEEITWEAWNTVQPPKDRITLMVSLPLVNQAWKEIYARISSQKIHVPNLQYLYYLFRCVHSGDSIIYGGNGHSGISLLSARASSITCLVDLRRARYIPNLEKSIGLDKKYIPDRYPFGEPVLDAYYALEMLRETTYTHLKTCFPHLEYINLETLSYTTPVQWKFEFEPFNSKRFPLQIRIHVDVTECCEDRSKEPRFALSVRIFGCAEQILDPTEKGHLDTSSRTLTSHWGPRIWEYMEVAGLQCSYYLETADRTKVFNAMMKDVKRFGNNLEDLEFSCSLNQIAYRRMLFRDLHDNGDTLDILDSYIRWAAQRVQSCSFGTPEESPLSRAMRRRQRLVGYIIPSQDPVCIIPVLNDTSTVVPNHVWVLKLFEHLYETEAWREVFDSPRQIRDFRQLPLFWPTLSERCIQQLVLPVHEYERLAKLRLTF